MRPYVPLDFEQILTFSPQNGEKMLFLYQNHVFFQTLWAPPDQNNHFKAMKWVFSIRRGLNLKIPMNNLEIDK